MNNFTSNDDTFEAFGDSRFSSGEVEFFVDANQFGVRAEDDYSTVWFRFEKNQFEAFRDWVNKVEVK